MKKLLAGVALTAATLSLTACGGGSSANSHAKDSLKQYLITDAKSDTTNPMNDANAAGCVANGLVDKIGVDQLTKYGILDKDGNASKAKFDNAGASKADATAFADTFMSCVGEDKIVSQLKASILKDQPNAPAAVKSCIDTIVDNKMVHDMLVAELAGKNDPDAQTTVKDFTTKLMACSMKAMGK